MVADVTGKGVPEALLVSSLHAYLSAYLEVPGTLPELLGKPNRALYNTSTIDKFVTAFIALLSPGTGELEYSSAGHNPCYLLKEDGTVRELKTGGFPLWAFDMDMPYPSERLQIGKTDGVTEAANELYERHRPDKAEIFIAELKDFTGPAPQNDDVTALYLYRRR